MFQTAVACHVATCLYLNVCLHISHKKTITKCSKFFWNPLEVFKITLVGKNSNSKQKILNNFNYFSAFEHFRRTMEQLFILLYCVTYKKLKLFFSIKLICLNLFETRKGQQQKDINSREKESGVTKRVNIVYEQQTNSSKHET